MKYLSIFIFSKNRACQLDALLRSLKLNFKEWNDSEVNILYNYDNNLFGRGYEKVQIDHPEFNYIKENNFRNDFLNIIQKASSDWLCGFTDDTIFKNTFSLLEEEFIFFQKNISSLKLISLSLRLYPGIQFCYPMNNLFSPHPKFIHDKYLIWNWTKLTPDWGYPLSIDSHVFNKEHFSFLISKFDFQNPNILESNLDYLSKIYFKNSLKYFVINNDISFRWNYIFNYFNLISSNI